MSGELASYAVKQSSSKSRLVNEKRHPYRGGFERDRDRIIHSSAFRRLEGKTQVFTPGLNDHYRTRLTHSIEVAQIGRTIARALKLNEDLTEAICLGHDLGHSPFGHLGESVLSEIMKGHGGFEHNRQTLRVVEFLEKPYADFAGLNLMYETRLGFAKHQSPYDSPACPTAKFNEKVCSLEGQIADVADRIAYNCHDLEDGLRARILTESQIKALEICNEAIEKSNVDMIDDIFVKRNRIAKTIINILVSDLLTTSSKAIKAAGIYGVDDVYRFGRSVIGISNASEGKLKRLEKFLYDNLYMHENIRDGIEKVSGWLGELFDRFVKTPELMPKYYQNFIDENGIHRSVCDYISGMTDRYCLNLLDVKSEYS